MITKIPTWLSKLVEFDYVNSLYVKMNLNQIQAKQDENV